MHQNTLKLLGFHATQLPSHKLLERENDWPHSWAIEPLSTNHSTMVAKIHERADKPSKLGALAVFQGLSRSENETEKRGGQKEYK